MCCDGELCVQNVCAGDCSTNADCLARLGAKQLVKTPDALPSERLDSATKAVRETLVLAKHPRLITALAPAIVRNIDAINLHQVNVELAQVGPQRRGSVYRETKRAVHSPDYLIGDDALVQHIRAMTSK